MRPSKGSDDRADETRCDERPGHVDRQSEAEIVVDETLELGAESERPSTSAPKIPEQGAGHSGTPTVAFDTFGDEHEQRHPAITKTLMLDHDDSAQPSDRADSEPPSRGKTLDLAEDRGHATRGRCGTPTVAFENLGDGQEPRHQVTKTLMLDQDDSVQPSDRAGSEPPSRGKTLDLDEDRGHAHSRTLRDPDRCLRKLGRRTGTTPPSDKDADARSRRFCTAVRPCEFRTTQIEARRSTWMKIVGMPLPDAPGPPPSPSKTWTHRPNAMKPIRRCARRC